MNNIAFAYALVFHILLDFYCQGDRVAKEKERNIKALLLHCTLYALGFGVLAGTMFELGPLGMLGFAGVTLVSHFVIDGPIRRFAKRRGVNELLRFVFDQSLHVAVLVVLLFFSGVAAKTALQGYEMRVMLAWASVILCCGKPAAIAISTVLCCARLHSGDEGSSVGPKSGRWIGILERMLVLALSMLGEYSAIAFVFTAKSIARFKEIEQNRDFAEVYLLGTLASVTIALFAALAAKALAGI